MTYVYLDPPWRVPVFHVDPPGSVGPGWMPIDGVQLWSGWSPWRDTAAARVIVGGWTRSVDVTITRELWELLDHSLRLPSPPWSPAWREAAA